jgi:hypothetical protein
LSAWLAEPVELGDHQLVALTQHEQGLVEFGPAGELSARLVGEHLLAAGSLEGVLLGLGMLIAGRDPCHADSHTPDWIAKGVVRPKGAYTAAVTDPTCGNVRPIVM